MTCLAPCTVYSCKCFKSEIEVSAGGFRDLMDDFGHFRQEKFEAEEARVKEDPLCCSKYAYSAYKRREVAKEIDRLMDGFAGNSGFLKEFVAQVKIPNWQKSAKWIDSSDVNHCYHCEKPFTLPNRKINCRIGGQVFCTKCSEDKMVVYLEEKNGEPKWGINGKIGVQTTDLARFEMYRICAICSDDLRTIFFENAVFESLLQSSAFLDGVCQIQQIVIKLQEKVEKWLPDYLQAVEALNAISTSKMSKEVVKEIDQKKLAKLHFDLINAQSIIEERHYNNLQKLQPQTATQERILKNVLVGIHTCFEEHKCQMDKSHRLLFRDVIEELGKVQKVSSQQSMEQVYVDVRQMEADVSENTKRFNLDGSILEHTEKILLAIKEEFLTDNAWEKDYEAMMKIRRKTFQPRISEFGHHDVMTPDMVQCMITGYCSTTAHKCCSQLEANTLEQEFEKTKHNLNNAWMKF